MREMATTTKHQKSYLPAAGHDWLLPFYDVVTKLMGADRARTDLVRQAALSPGQRVLDIGCGTGSLVVLVKRLYPSIEIIGLDPDPKALDRARRKAQRAGVQVQFEEGLSESLPNPGQSFDQVFSSLMFHHLERDAKERTLREIRRVLKPGGYLHLLDFDGPGPARRGVLSRWLHEHHPLKDNSEAQILALMAQAGLSDAKVAGRHSVLFGMGEAVSYRASAPARDLSV